MRLRRGPSELSDGWFRIRNAKEAIGRGVARRWEAFDETQSRDYDRDRRHRRRNANRRRGRNTDRRRGRNTDRRRRRRKADRHKEQQSCHHFASVRHMGTTRSTPPRDSQNPGHQHSATSRVVNKPRSPVQRYDTLTARTCSWHFVLQISRGDAAHRHLAAGRRHGARHCP